MRRKFLMEFYFVMKFCSLFTGPLEHYNYFMYTVHHRVEGSNLL